MKMNLELHKENCTWIYYENEPGALQIELNLELINTMEVDMELYKWN
jgi:hypothetical protein